jgi:hypothetical protein
VTESSGVAAYAFVEMKDHRYLVPNVPWLLLQSWYSLGIFRVVFILAFDLLTPKSRLTSPDQTNLKKAETTFLIMSASG